MTNPMRTILITNQPDIARTAQDAGVTRIMVDLEEMGKKERQASRNTFISTHRKEDVAAIRAVLDKSELIVRINPWHAGSKDEVDHAIKSGADIIMLPMILQLTQLESFLTHLAGRAHALPLIETGYSMENIDVIAAHPAIPEIYIGLNDLHLSLGLSFLFEPLALGLLDTMAERIKAHNKPFGFGGIAAIGSGELPAEWILAEHARIGSDCVILSSRFGKDIRIEDPEGRAERLSEALARLHTTYGQLQLRTPEERMQDKAKLDERIRSIAEKFRPPQ